jgi:hypothetical protein
MAGLDPPIPLRVAQPCHMIGIAGSSLAMTAGRLESASCRETERAANAVAHVSPPLSADAAA